MHQNHPCATVDDDDDDELTMNMKIMIFVNYLLICFIDYGLMTVIIQVPYDKTSKIPGKARLQTFACLERNRLVMVISLLRSLQKSKIV